MMESTIISSKPTRPIVRYHGGKWRMAPWLISMFPSHECYVEPFAGAASVLLQKPRSRVEVLNDKYERIVSAFRVLRDPALAEKLSHLLRLTPFAEVEYRSAREISPDPLEDARRLIVLGSQCHGSTGSSGGKLGGWRRRYCGHGGNNEQEWGDLWEIVSVWSDRLRSVYLECSDGLQIIPRWDSPNTLFCVDPPYMTSTRSEGSGKRGYAHEMSDEAHIRLAQVLSQVEGMVVISGYPSQLYDDELYAGWYRFSRKMPTAARSRMATEVVWTNFQPRSQSNLFTLVK